ncbi:TauD/TfdA family dioxygenase [Streptomyces sp. ODS05-4]|uniref:TauD/TfdA dioxygenase family protein n=1 Tax=Streptomyces sp. ODS05-4 TaxID=2944939 RepID=UPI00272ECB87|nr:TauD/TfdA family dioxygenase [Streptomyces sp. ODS05-4]
MEPLPRIRQVSLALGAEVHGVDLSRELSADVWKAIEDAFHEHSVLVFPGQHLTVEQQKTFARHFGKLVVHEHLLPMTVEGHPECMVLHNNEQKPPGLNDWHTDNSGWPEPPLGTVLHAKVTPEIGGDTLYSNMHLAYESLSAPLRTMLLELTAVHDVAKAFGREFANLQKSLRKKGIDPDSHFSGYAPVKHPLVRTHPVTGRRALYISSPYITHIDGLSDKESRALLDLLYRHAATDEFVYRHRWTEGDLLLWDNRCTQHLAVADYFPRERLMHRMNIHGDKPYLKL